jgi:hypothetical protein
MEACIRKMIDSFYEKEISVLGLRNNHLMRRLYFNVYIATLNCKKHPNEKLQILLEDIFLRHVGIDTTVMQPTNSILPIV